MNKLIIIETHGVSTIEGTKIHCLAAFANVDTRFLDLVAAYLYDERGVLVDRKFNTYASWENIR